MGQTCTFPNQQLVNRLYQITTEESKKQQNFEWSKEVNVCQQKVNPQHKVPKTSSLNIKTLTEKNLESDKMLQSREMPLSKPAAKINGLDFFKQFNTLKELIELKELQFEGIHEDEKQNQVSHEGDILESIMNSNNQIKQSLNKFVQQEKVFKNIEVNIEDFIRISEQPITEYYEFKEKIGEGSFGNVYRAICKTSKEERAIKVLKKKQMSKQTKKQFLAEMQLLSKLDHPNIIKVYELYYYNFFYYVVTEYCKGGTILNYINDQTNYGEKFVSKIIKQLLSALMYLHLNCIVHLDIKLENVVFLQKCNSPDDKVYIKLIDFGCSKHFVPFKKKKAKISGTLSYIAPECLQGYYSQKCDMWSTGVLLYILLSGISPFKGRDSKQTIKNIETKTITFEGKIWQKISESAKDLINNMLNRTPNKRISAKIALQHKWFEKMKNSRSAIINPEVIKNLEKYYRGNNFVTIIETFISLRKINQEERKKLTDIFQVMDSDNSGTIEVSELFEVYKKYFGHHDIAQIQHIINKIDLNKSSSINFNEFLVAMSNRKTMFEGQHLKEAFNYFDIDKTGYLEKNQLRQILKGCEKEEFDFILKELDKDGDQKVSKEEFVSYLVKF